MHTLNVQRQSSRSEIAKHYCSKFYIINLQSILLLSHIMVNHCSTVVKIYSAIIDVELKSIFCFCLFLPFYITFVVADAFYGFDHYTIKTRPCLCDSDEFSPLLDHQPLLIVSELNVLHHIDCVIPFSPEYLAEIQMFSTVNCTSAQLN